MSRKALRVVVARCSMWHGLSHSQWWSIRKVERVGVTERADLNLETSLSCLHVSTAFKFADRRLSYTREEEGVGSPADIPLIKGVADRHD